MARAGSGMRRRSLESQNQLIIVVTPDDRDRHRGPDRRNYTASHKLSLPPTCIFLISADPDNERTQPFYGRSTIAAESLFAIYFCGTSDGNASAANDYER